MKHDRKPTTKEVKESIKYHIYICGLDPKEVSKNLRVTNRAIIFALREESKEQYILKYAQMELKAAKDNCFKIIDRWVHVMRHGVRSDTIHGLITSLEDAYKELGRNEIIVYGERLE